MIRHWFRDRWLAAARRSSIPLAPEQLSRPTLVLAPHPDDETLGCGGLVAMMSDRATPVTIVFMTDGAASHDSSADLVARRRLEAAAAAQTLGMSSTDLRFLDHPDGGLSRCAERASADLADVIASARPAQIVLPHPLEPNADHAATFVVAQQALSRLRLELDALLYLVWLWDQWPYTNPLAPPRGRHGRRSALKLAARGRLGTVIPRHVTHHLDVSLVLDRKRMALACHETQTAKRADGAEWLTLADVAGGEWLDLLMRDEELYCSRRLGETWCR